MRRPLLPLLLTIACLASAPAQAAGPLQVISLPPEPGARSQLLRDLSLHGWTTIGTLSRDRLLVQPPTGALVPTPLPIDVRPFGAEERLSTGWAEHDGPFAVHPVPGVSPADLADELGASGWSARASERFVAIDAPIASSALRELAGRASVQAVVPVREAVPADDPRGTLQSGVARVEPFHAAGLGGQGEIIAVADSGLELGCSFDDPSSAPAFERVDPSLPPMIPMTSPTHRKVHAYQSWTFGDFDDEADASVLGYHGTAVAGTAAGDRAPWTEGPVLYPNALPARVNAGALDGHAPGARLVVQDLHVSGGSYSVPMDLAGLVTAAHRAGARTWNASWTTGSAGIYDHFSREIDVAAWTFPGLVIAVSAGNSGPGPSTVEPPSTNRNGLAVGNSGTGAWVEDLDRWSAWGPAADGRRKPDLTGPGSGGLEVPHGGSACTHATASGTSIAAPAVAAAAALVRQYFREGREAGGFPRSALPRNPSAALVRAVLAASTQSLAGGPLPDVNEGITPSPEQGWGRVVLGNALPLPGAPFTLTVHSDDDVALGTDGFAVGATSPLDFTLNVVDPTEPLVVALAFTDAPPAPAATSPVVNDVNLEVASPRGTIYLGNVLNGGWSIPGGAPDPANNLELVRVPPPVEPGPWTLRVRPASIVMGRQPVALVSVAGACRAPGPFLAQPEVVEAWCGQLAVSAPSVGGGPSLRYSLYRSDTPGGQDFSSPLVAGLERAVHVDTPPVTGRPYYYVFVAEDACGGRRPSGEGWGFTESPCRAGDLRLRVAKSTGGLLRLHWNDPGFAHDVRTHPVPLAVRAGPILGTSATGELFQTIPAGRLVTYVVD